MKSKLDKIVEIGQDLLYNFQPAESCLQYINTRLSTIIQKKFKIGYLPSIQYLDYLKTLIPLQELEACNLLYHNQSAYSLNLEHHNLIIPYYDVYGNIISLIGRTLLDEVQRKELKIAKYKNLSFNKGLHLFGLNHAKEYIKQKNCAIIVEGQFDCISCVEHGLDNVVALGSSNMTIEQLFLILRYCDRISLLLDNDAAGIQGALKIKEKFSKYCQIVDHQLPVGYKDIDEYLSNNTHSHHLTIKEISSLLEEGHQLEQKLAPRIRKMWNFTAEDYYFSCK